MKMFWKNANFALRSGLIITAIFFIIGFVVYLIPHADPFNFNTYQPKLGASGEHLLGTTSMGQDVLWLLIEAIHNSLVIGLIVATIGTVVGVFVGLLSGFAGGALDRVLMVVTDTFVVIPSLPILILMTSLMKGTSTVILIALVLAMFAWAWPSRQIRSMALTLKERDFIQTAKFSGEGTIQIVVTEILPFALTWSLSNFMNATLNAIASESSLAVLGLSPANLISLGNMIQWARERNAIFNKQWLWIGSPIVATIVMFIGLFLLITGYNDYLAMKRGR
ncbi:ABC transporter permease [Butyrivibrio sp. WCD3002]|uniref:ABC transporter permease n=1 Tax=Butyrivibrio sp. WCD3002 TaxID=1280676 RepID=UPI0004078112|nr:ABC transporter permease [Butyrivibrio sp. WCD3002]